MVNWEEVIKTESIEELRDVKLWLFKENMRLENEKKEFSHMQDKFLEEQTKLKNEIDVLERKTAFERKRLKEDTLFFNKKLEILKDGFRQLDEDRRHFERDKKEFEQTRLSYEENKKHSSISVGNVVELLFRTANNPLTLRKRYRDLVKIFHPDNLCGDAELVQMINQEFVNRKEKM